MSVATLNDRIHTILKQLDTECPLDEVMDLCPDITWNQIFSAIDILSRTGQVRVRIDAEGIYWVQSDPHGAREYSPALPDTHQSFESKLNVP